MRKILLSIVLLLFILPFVISCSDDDGPTFDENLIGKWERKVNNISSIDTIEFTSDFKYRESRYNSITKTSSWSDWVDYQIKGKSKVVPNATEIKIQTKIYSYTVSNNKMTMEEHLRDGSLYSLSYTKVE